MSFRNSAGFGVPGHIYRCPDPLFFLTEDTC
jgi:hypothetical protein